MYRCPSKLIYAGTHAMIADPTALEAKLQLQFSTDPTRAPAVLSTLLLDECQHLPEQLRVRLVCCELWFSNLLAGTLATFVQLPSILAL